MKHIGNLDGIRGIAILLVMLLHLAVFEKKNLLDEIVFSIASIGWIGVDLFFVLSGMLITGILLDTKSKPKYFRNFYIRRSLRIFPLYYSLLILTLYVLPLFPHPKHESFSRVYGSEIWYCLFLSNFSIAYQGRPVHGIMDVTWSLAIEEQFYLLWPLVVRYLNKSRLAALCLILIVVSLVSRILLLKADIAPYSVYVLTPARLDGLCCGALTAILLRSEMWNSSQLNQIAKYAMRISAMGLFPIVFLSRGLPWDGVIVQTIGITVLCIFFSGLTMRAYIESGSSTYIDKLTAFNFFVRFGVLSYSLYLFHLPISSLLRDTLLKPERFQDWFGSSLIGQFIFYCLATVLSLIAAWLSFHLFEKHFLKLKNKLAS